MRKLLALLTLLALPAMADSNASDAARILTGSALPPLPFNIIPNANFEDRTTGWSVTGGTFTTTTTTSHVARGRFSASWTVPASTTSGVLLQTQAITIPAGLYGRACIAGLLYQGSAGTNGSMQIEAYDGTNILGANPFGGDASNYTKIQSVAFTCPTSGTIRLRVKTTATTPATPTPVYFDEAYLADYDSVGGSGGGSFVVNGPNTYAASGIISAGSDVRSITYVAGASTAVTLSASTPISNGATGGNERLIVGTSSTNTVTIPNSGNMVMNAPVTLKAGDVIGFIWDGTNSKWRETYRSSPLLSTNAQSKQVVITATTSSCTSSPCTITSQSGSTSSGFSSITRTSTGRYVANFASGVFSAAPVCLVNGGEGPASFNTTPTTSNVDFTIRGSGFSATDSVIFIQCIGAQ